MSRRYKFFKWVITFEPQDPNLIPKNWSVATKHNILGIKFILWEI